MIKGDPKIDALTCGEITINLMASPKALHVKAAFVNSETGATHGWTTGSAWSEVVWTRVTELCEALEDELAKLHFSSHEAASTAALAGGIGEDLESPEGFDAPPV